MINRKNIIRVIIVIFVTYIFLSVFMPKLLGTDKYVSDSLDDGISITINYTDGTSKQFEDNYFPVVNAGDEVIATIKIPQERWVENAAMCFYIDHCAFQVFSGDRLIYSYGQKQAQEGSQIGSVYPKVLIPDEAWGHELTLVCDVTENHGFSKLNNFTVLPAFEGYKYAFIGHPAEFIVFMGVGLLSFVVLLFILSRGDFSCESRQAIWISLFGVLVSIWILAYYGMFNLFFEEITLCSVLEYIALYLVPIPICMFFYEVEKKKPIKYLLGGYAAFLFVFFLICTILNYTTANHHYSQNISMLHILIGIGSTGIIIVCFTDRREDNVAKGIMKYGFTLLMFMAIIDAVRYNVDKYIGIKSNIMTVTVTPIGVLLFIAGLVASFLIMQANNLMNKKDKEQLTRLAYLDVMTGVSNRTECDRYIKELTDRGVKDYSIVFFDLNRLKETNDVYGHEIGDKYIRGIAAALRDSFGDAGFCGRMGGDEFIAIVIGRKSRFTASYLEDFEEQVRQFNESKAIPVEISVARGIVISTQRTPLDIEEAVREADKKMYENKMASRRK